MLDQLRVQLRPLLEDIASSGGRAFFVGGIVRDAIMGRDSKDVDIEVFHLGVDQLLEVLQRHGRVDIVGRNFGVLKLRMNGETIDISLPRSESKTGQGHRGFLVNPDPTLSPVEAASRRDFTMNAMMVDAHTGDLLDPFNGATDIQNQILRHVGPNFRDDPLRVLRGMQFAARFDMVMHSGTANLCLRLRDEFLTISKERFWIEFEKLATKGINPSRGMHILEQTGWIKMFPQLDYMRFIPQDAGWHPEGDVFTHSVLAMNQAVRIADRDNLNDHDRTMLVLAALLHDTGKVETTIFKDGRIRSPGHAQAGVPLSLAFLRSIGAPEDIKKEVSLLVQEHMCHIDLPRTATPVRRLANRLNPVTIEQFVRLVEADASGRELGIHSPAADLLPIAMLAGASDGKVARIIEGRNVIQLGIQPGPAVGKLVQEAYQAQIDGEFDSIESGMEWLRNRLDNR